MRFPKAKLTGRKGLNFVEAVALGAGCKLIPFPEDLDTGVDGFIEFAENDEALGKIVAFQVKCGDSFFERNSPRVQTSAAHLRYWRDYSVPVLLIVVSSDGGAKYWMDTREHIDAHPELVEFGPYVLRPSLSRPFDSATLRKAILPRYASRIEFGEVLTRLCDHTADRRMSGIELLYRFRGERRGAFALASALLLEADPDTLLALCDIFSRYLGHPESSFDVPLSLRDYARSLLDAGKGDALLIRILSSFESDENLLDGAVEIFNMHPEQIWVRHDIIERGTRAQGLAVVVDRIATQGQLQAIFTDERQPGSARRAAAALFGYLGHTCGVDALDAVIDGANDSVLIALLTWLRYWMLAEQDEE